MNLTQRDKRALMLLGGALAIALAVAFWPESAPATTVAAADSVELAQRRLLKLKQVQSSLATREEMVKNSTADLAAMEKGLIQADTPAQAQAQLMQVVRKIGRAQIPPVDVKSSEMGGMRALGEHYGEVSVSLNMECQIDQLLNMMSDLTAQPELLSTTELRVGAASQKDKAMPVRLTVSGIVEKKLMPVKRAGTL